MSSSREPVRGKPLVERVDQIRQIALALGQREAAGRQRDAGHRIAPQARPAGAIRPCSRDDAPRSSARFVRRDVGDDQVLVRA